MFYYIPAEDRAYEIMKDWQDTTPFAMMYRNMHRWSAHMMVLICLPPYVAGVLYRIVQRERRFNWVIGVMLMLLTLLLSFTGYLLPWDQLAFWAITVEPILPAMFLICRVLSTISTASCCLPRQMSAKML